MCIVPHPVGLYSTCVAQLHKSTRFFLHHGRSMLSGSLYGMIQLTTLSMTIGKMQFVSNAGIGMEAGSV